METVLDLSARTDNMKACPSPFTHIDSIHNSTPSPSDRTRSPSNSIDSAPSPAASDAGVKDLRSGSLSSDDYPQSSERSLPRGIARSNGVHNNGVHSNQRRASSGSPDVVTSSSGARLDPEPETDRCDITSALTINTGTPPLNAGSVSGNGLLAARAEIHKLYPGFGDPAAAYSQMALAASLYAQRNPGAPMLPHSAAAAMLAAGAAGGIPPPPLYPDAISSPLPSPALTSPISSLLSSSRKRKSASPSIKTDRTHDSSTPPPAKKPATPSGGEEKCCAHGRDDSYWERRRKNNEAAKRSRDTRRAKEEQIAARARLLEEENLRLRTQVAVLKTETAKLHYMLYNRM